MSALDKLICLDSVSLARFKAVVFIDRTNYVVNIFQNIENEHNYVYIEPENDKYLLNIGNFYADNNGNYFMDTPYEITRINKTEYKKIKKWIDSVPEITLSHEVVEVMARNKFFNFNFTNK